MQHIPAVAQKDYYTYAGRDPRLVAHVIRQWTDMLRKVYDRTDPRYSYTGGREGVGIYWRWHELSSFAEWAFLSGAKIGKDMLRIDRGRSYKPDNCVWM